MKFKIGDIVEVIEILPSWDIYEDRHKIFDKPFKIVDYENPFYSVKIPVTNDNAIFLKEKRLKLYVANKQLLFDFMKD